MADPSGLVVLFTRCIGSDTDGWHGWCEGEHLPGLRELPSVRSATRSAVTPPPTLGGPGLGFTHAELIELVGDVDRASGAVAAALLRAGAPPQHAVVHGETVVPHGPVVRPRPDADVTGHVLANVLCADRRSEDEWDRWYDEVHLPDMMATGAFRAGSRWRRERRPAWGAAHLTLYDVGPGPVAEAVDRSAAAMPDLIAAGRKHPRHSGGLTVALDRTA